jgi:4-amino-4-deoxychorismate lyase
MIFKNGFLTDTSIANIAIFDGDNWLTPKKPLLEGTTRNRLLENKDIIESNIDLNMLKNAKKIALMNAMIDFDILEDYSFFE